MGKQIKATGKSVDEAIWNGINELGLSLDEVTIETVQKGTTGLLGIGSKPAIVMITEKSSDAIDIKSLFEESTQSGAAQCEQPPKKRQSEDKVRRTRTIESVIPQPRPVPQRYHKEEVQEVKPVQEVCVVAPVQQPCKESNPKPAVNEEQETISYSVETAMNNEAAQFLIQLLDKIGTPATVLAAETEEGLKLKIESEAAGVLIGHRGETLDALQYITLLVANRNRSQKEYTRISIDTQGYREKREETLIRLAKSKASTVRANGRAYKFEPMSPYERRIIHATLQNNSHVATHSEGVEPHRYVVITSNNAQRRYQRKPAAPKSEN